MRTIARGTLLVLVLLLVCPLLGQERSIETRLERIERQVKDQDTGIVLFLSGAFCALWAQNTGRSAWLWFFLGALFSVIPILFLLSKNAEDLASKRRGAPQNPGGMVP